MTIPDWAPWTGAAIFILDRVWQGGAIYSTWKRLKEDQPRQHEENKRRMHKLAVRLIRATQKINQLEERNARADKIHEAMLQRLQALEHRDPPEDP